MFDFKLNKELEQGYDQRRQKRLAWRNERNLYRRKCDKTGGPILSVYSPQMPFPVYGPQAWYSDDWDELAYGQDFDFNRPFFEQFHELQCKVPRISNILVNTVNCDYCNTIGDCKNCYLIAGSVNCEDCLYGSPFDCKNCIDSLLVRNSEYCYECTDCNGLYECFFCQNCENSRGLKYCFDVNGSQDCFLCVGLRHAQYCVLNQQYTKEEYARKIAEFKKYEPEKLRQMLHELKIKTPVKCMEGSNNENVVGDLMFNSKNCYYTFNSKGCEEVHFSTQLLETNYCTDCDYGEYGNHAYGCSGFYKASNIFFCHWSWEISDSYYCSISHGNTQNCFGCISLRRKKYCILNKQYTRDEYEKMLPRIIEYMKKTGEWGQFFPMKYSPFSYNESVAQEYFPMGPDEVATNGLRWHEPESPVSGNLKIVEAKDLPFSASEVGDDILNVAIKCNVEGRLFKLMPTELAFYKRYDLPLPKYHPDERHKKRLDLRNPYHLYDRKCAKTGAPIKTSYPPESPQIVYSEEAYLKERY